MSFFDLFEIPVQLKVEKSALPHKYFELSRKYHPDLFVNADPEEQAMALERSALLNKAFRTFQNPDETIKYVLQLKGLLEEEEKYDLPPSFLMEVMDINEALMEAAGPENRASLLGSIDELQARIYEPVQAIIAGYRDGISPEKDLLLVKEYYYKKKYIDRIRQQIH